MPNNPLIDAASLAPRLDDPGWVIVDCRFTLTDASAGRAAYLRAHIPGARYADLDRDLSRGPRAEEGRHPLPASDDFAATLGGWGITPDTTVVAYDEGGGAIAARLWWMLRWLGHERTLVLDGGLASWEAAGLPVEAKPPAVQATQYSPRRVDASGVVTTEQLPQIMAAGDVLIDARGAARYRGEQEPIDPVAGHVPGALNRPFSENLDSTGRFRAAAQLKAEIEALLGGRDARATVAMCGSGVTACHLLLAMAVAGLDTGKLYAGSWSEWIRDPHRPIRTGAAP